MFLDMSAGYRSDAIFKHWGKIAFGLRPRTRSRPSTIDACEAGPERTREPQANPGETATARRNPGARGVLLAPHGRTVAGSGRYQAAILSPGPIALEAPIASCRSPDRWLFIVLFDVRSARACRQGQVVRLR